KPLTASLRLVTQDGHTVVVSSERHGTTPSWWFAEVAAPAKGAFEALLEGGGARLACTSVAVGGHRAARPAPSATPGAPWRAPPVGARHGKPVRGLDREAFRRPGRRAAHVARAARGAPRSHPQFSSRLSVRGRRQGRARRASDRPRLRGPALLSPGVFRVQAR